ncbi:hypothetical protein [Amycolatopsis sp. NPDC051372]|uniref:hypothetical protein n=1 Tax=Amycolatopsis sp. NPDC051372 TaxID=3155669 RepID=UPI0034156219
MAFVLFAYARKTAESQAWAANKAKEEQAAKTRSPLRELFRGDNLRSLGQVFLLMTGIWFAIQMLTVAPSGLLISYLHLPSRSVIWGILAANVVLFPVTCSSARFGRRRTLIVCGI